MDDKNKKLLIIGDKIDRKIFKLLGAITFDLNKKGRNNLSELIVSKKDDIAAVLISSEIYDQDPKLIKKIKKTDLPFIKLPSRKSEKSSTGLEKLLSETIGMEIKHE